MKTGLCAFSPGTMLRKNDASTARVTAGKVTQPECYCFLFSTNAVRALKHLTKISPILSNLWTEKAVYHALNLNVLLLKMIRYRKFYNSNSEDFSARISHRFK